MKIYNLFPRLAGPCGDWAPHLERAAAMGFDWIFVNPIQRTGRSRSLYSIADYFAIDPDFVDPESEAKPDDQVRAMIARAEELGLSVMTDLVINHCAIDSALTKRHADWFVRHGRKIANPFCLEADGTRVVWHDLAQFDHEHSPDCKGLIDYCAKLIEHLIGLGFKGFRCDAAYQIPSSTWETLIRRIRRRHPDTLFAAETLGCSPEQTRATAEAGFDAIFNSSKWWDFGSPWLLEQYASTRDLVPSISFPESHDTERLFSECGGNPRAMEQRYLFAAFFSTSVMIPIGFEYGFRCRLDVVNTRPDHWESPNLDLTPFITGINRLRDAHPVLRSEGPIELIETSNPAIMLLHKRLPDAEQELILALNKDPWNRQYLRVENLYRHLSRPHTLKDLSLEWTMDYLPTPFEFDLAPGMGRILVTSED
ncbi:alpha-amylase family glycosyl hydrolase [Imhoffiella purpurea]|uniref:Alpha-amylase n=1 Tax=Imhoffiella purpurea TaxID=1249627 RepID=W9VCC2_9GAMM|nr:alpha-amylase family glycosyl hydrolase [Imhoffiella purpurea]EXJ14636.1 Alpha-amylase [Imhoffiella purpurea]